MITTRIRQFLGTMREGFNAGFVAALVIIFLILIGIPIRIETLALFTMMLVAAIFGARLARSLRERSLSFVLKNTLAMGVATMLIVFLFLSLINGWQAKGIDVKEYFDAVNLNTMHVLSGVPVDELHPDPVANPLTGEYPEGEPFRTDPMTLRFDEDTGLRFKLGFGDSTWIDINMIIGGLYGFLLLLMLAALVGAVIARAIMVFNARERTFDLAALNPDSTLGQLARVMAPARRIVVLIMPLILFAFLWLTEAHGDLGGPLLDLGDGSQEIQLLLSFGIILAALVAVRAAEPTAWGLPYELRVGVVLGVLALLVIIALVRVETNNTYFVTLPGTPKGSPGLCFAIIIFIGLIMAAQSVMALRNAERFETQLAGVLGIGLIMLMPLFLDQYQNDVLTLVGINIMLGLGLNIVVGYAGLLDLGYVAFFALGAYTYAFLSSNEPEFDASNEAVGLKFAGNDAMVVKLIGWVVITVLIASAVIAVGLYLWRRSRQGQKREAVVQGRTLLRLPSYPGREITLLLTVVAVGASFLVASLLESSGLYHDMFDRTPPFLVGLIAGMIVAGLSGILLGIPVLRLRGDYLAIVTLGFGEIIRLLFNNLRDYTGGPRGVLLIPRPLHEDASGPISYLSILYLVFIGAGVVAFFSARLKHSRTGRAWSAMRSDEDIAQSMGVNLVQSKLTAFAIGATFAGIGGVIFAARQRNIFPADFNLEVSIEVLSLVIIGGMGSIPGVIMGAIALIGVPEVLRELAQYRILAFGALLVAMVIIRPEGLLPAPPTRLQERAEELHHTDDPGSSSEEAML